jgi:hypothetical protein
MHTKTAGVPEVKAKKEKETGGVFVHDDFGLAESRLACQVEFSCRNEENSGFIPPGQCI